MTAVTLRPVGQSPGIELPPDLLERLGLEAGDALLLSESGDGTLRIARAGPGRDAQMALARQGVRDDRDARRELAR